MGIFRTITDSGYWGDTYGSCNDTFCDGTIMENGKIVGTVEDDGYVYDCYGHHTDFTHEED